MINGGDNQTPYLHLNLGTDSVKNRNWAILDQRLYDLARGSIANIPAGGDLSGFYPDPVIKDGAMTPAKIAPGGDPGESLTIDGTGHLVWVSGLPAIPSGPAGGDLAGSTYPNPIIKNGALTPNKIALGGTAGQVLTINAGGNLVWVAPSAPLADVWIDTGTVLQPANGALYPVNCGNLTVASIMNASGASDGSTIGSVVVTSHGVAPTQTAQVIIARSRQFLGTVQSGDLLGTFQWNGLYTGSSYAVGASIVASAAENYSVAATGSRLVFSVAALTAGLGTTARLTINPDGTLRATVDPSNALDLVTKQYVDGKVAAIPPSTTIAPTAPASPQQGQLWWRNDPDGNLFISYNDGNSTQWVPAVPSSAPQWVVSGSSLTPVDATKSVAVTGSPTAAVIVGGFTPKTRLSSHGGTGAAAFFTQNAIPGTSQDDATKSSWLLQLRSDTDQCLVTRYPPGSVSGTNVLTLDATGALTTGNHYADCRRMTPQSIPNATSTPVVFDNIGGLGGMATQPASVITIQQAGRYVMTASVMWAGATGGAIRRAIIEAVTGGSTTRDFAMSDLPATTATGPTGNALSATWSFAAGDTIKLIVYQDSGTALNITAQWNAQAACLGITRIG